VAFSFYVKKWIGQKTWRTIHFLSYGALLGALIHGITAGTDTANPFVAGMYAGVLVIVVLLTAIRFIAELGGGSTAAGSARTARVGRVAVARTADADPDTTTEAIGREATAEV
jgi:DMSO/TMAO reductase YedYZ heme-binding membrane subunit